MGTIIAIVVILIIMTVVIFFVLKSTVKNINEQGRSYFVLKLQQYDEEQNSDTLNNKDKEKENREELSSKDDTSKSASLVYMDSNDNYEVENLLDLVKAVDNKFSFDNEDVIKRFATMIANDKGLSDYKNLKEIKDYIEKIGVYDILTFDDDNKLDEVQENIKNIDSKIYSKYMNNRYEFDIEDFIDYLDNEIGMCDPTIYVYVGSKSENYDYVDERVKTIYDNKVYKGIKIIYKNKMYDYSLN